MNLITIFTNPDNSDISYGMIPGTLVDPKPGQLVTLPNGQGEQSIFVIQAAPNHPQSPYIGHLIEVGAGGIELPTYEAIQVFVKPYSEGNGNGA